MTTGQSNLEARLVVGKSHSRTKPWLVNDTGSPQCEDPVIYLFSSKAKAKAFRRELIAERSK